MDPACRVRDGYWINIGDRLQGARVQGLRVLLAADGPSLPCTGHKEMIASDLVMIGNARTAPLYLHPSRDRRRPGPSPTSPARVYAQPSLQYSTDTPLGIAQC